MSSILDAVTKDASRSGTIPGVDGSSPPPPGIGPGRYRSAAMVVVVGVLAGAVAARFFAGSEPVENLLTEKAASRPAKTEVAKFGQASKPHESVKLHDAAAKAPRRNGKQGKQEDAGGGRKHEPAVAPKPLAIPAPAPVVVTAPAASVPTPAAAPVGVVVVAPTKPASPTAPPAPPGVKPPATVVAAAPAPVAAAPDILGGVASSSILAGNAPAVPAGPADADVAVTERADDEGVDDAAVPAAGEISYDAPEGAPDVSILFVAWSHTPGDRLASMRIGTGSVSVVHEGEYVEGLQVATIHAESVDFQWTGHRFRIPVRAF